LPRWTNLVKSSLSKGEILPVRIGGGVPNKVDLLLKKRYNSNIEKHGGVP